MSSLRRRLLFIFVGLFVLGWLTVVAATYGVAARRIQLLFDAELAHDAQVLLALVTHRAGGTAADSEPPLEVKLGVRESHRVLVFQVWKDDKLLLRSAGAPRFPPPIAPGFTDQTIADRAWRVFSVAAPGRPLSVQVAEPRSIRGTLVYAITRDALFPLVLAIPVLAAAIWLGVRRGLEPLRRVAAQVAERSPAQLDPVSLERVPAEINGLVSELNTLLARLHEAFEKERRFTADAAHEIRTPLAGIKTNAQVALRSTTDEQRRQALTQIVQGTNRTTHLVEQLLTLARLDREAIENKFSPVMLSTLAAEIISEYAPAAAKKHIDLELRQNSRGEINGSPAALVIMIRNLLDNAVRYTPRDGSVSVRVDRDANTVILAVTDNGPGISDEDRSRVFDRFYRGTTNNSAGCGLGLSIVKRIAELHNATVELTKPEAGVGLAVRLVFHYPLHATPTNAPETKNRTQPLSGSKGQVGLGSLELTKH